ncbi:MAG: phosphate ABC transporter permease PstA [Methylococcaceae bacterium]|nr:phosphate ABC transporter permease PstA [Methylococcaceae bacterium]
MMKQWFKSGSPWIWLNAAAVSVCLILVVGLLTLVAVRGLGHFWPADIVEYRYQDEEKQTVVMGEEIDKSLLPAIQAKEAGYTLKDTNAEYLVQQLVKTGNRDLTGMDFRWIQQQNILETHYPKELIAVERREWGNFYGRLVSVKENGKVIATGVKAPEVLEARLQEALEIFDTIEHLQKTEIGAINYALERLRLKQRRLELEGEWNATTQAEIEIERASYDEEYKGYQQQLATLYKKIKRDSLQAKAANGVEIEIHLDNIVKVIQPNSMNVFQKTGAYFSNVYAFVMEDPREANTEGGIFPAIFGTVMMVMLMAVIVTPFGVIAAVYMREYADQGLMTRIIRIAVNNLAGVPSIVYGVFGLGFFVYILGGSIDELFYPESAPAPVFGTPGLMWASLTLALLTLPVVIVSTEEGLSRIPRSIREGSLALGATKAETLWRTILPMASPAMMTGLILAVARAAGEVAPLMLVGVVKLAPTLPLDGNFPFLHLDRKFMHLGFHIYDVGFQSPNVEAARPLVYATSLLLVIVIVGLNMAAIAIRNSLREKYRALEN